MYERTSWKYKKNKKIYDAMIESKPCFIVDTAHTYKKQANGDEWFEWFEDKLRIFQHNGKKWKCVEITANDYDWDQWSTIAYGDSDKNGCYCHYVEDSDRIDVWYDQMTGFDMLIFLYSIKRNEYVVNGTHIRTLKKVNSLEDFLKLIGMGNYKFKKSKRIYEAMIEDKPCFIIDSANTYEEDWREDKLRIFQHNGKRWKLVEITCYMDDWEERSVVRYYDSKNCSNCCYYIEERDDISGLQSHGQMIEFEDTVISCFADRSNSCCVNGVDIRTLKNVNSLEDFLKLTKMDKELGSQDE